MADLFSLDDLESVTPVNLQIAEQDVFCRLVYLLKTMQNINIPSWLKYKIQFINDIEKPLVLFSPLMKAAYNKGSVYGEGTLEEFKQVLHKVVASELKDFDDNKKFWDYVNALADGLFESNEEVWLEDIQNEGTIEKFNSGYVPFDKVTNGFYQAVVAVAGTPGTGKTSHLLSFMQQIAKYYPIWYFQTEIPGKVIRSRIAQIKPKAFLPKTVKVFTGNYNTDSILKLLEKDPDPDRIIIYDSPEIMNSSLEAKSYWLKTMQDLVSIKMQSRLVMFTSQTKQGLTFEQLGEYSLSDAAEKYRYADIVLYVGRIFDRALFKTSKNRLGALGEFSTVYDYSTLQVQNDFIDDMFKEKQDGKIDSKHI